MKLKTLLIIAGLTISSQAVTTVFSRAINADTGWSIDTSGTALVQTINQVQDFDGDGTNDTLTFRVTTESLNGVDFNGSTTTYDFRAAGGSYEMSYELVSFTSSNNHTITDTSLTLASFFKSGNGTYTVTNGTDSYSHVDANNTTSTGVGLDFDADDTITWTSSGTNGGVRSLNFGITVDTEAIPEPSSAALLGLGGLALLIRRKR